MIQIKKSQTNLKLSSFTLRGKKVTLQRKEASQYYEHQHSCDICLLNFQLIFLHTVINGKT